MKLSEYDLHHARFETSTLGVLSWEEIQKRGISHYGLELIQVLAIGESVSVLWYWSPVDCSQVVVTRLENV